MNYKMLRLKVRLTPVLQKNLIGTPTRNLTRVNGDMAMKKGMMILAMLLAMTSVADAVTLKRSVFGSAAASIQSGTVSMQATAGQPAVGTIQGFGAAAKIGFWYTVDTNLPPIADAGADLVGEGALACTTPSGVAVTLDGSGSSDPNNDTLTYQWLENETEIATGVRPDVTLELGSHTITLIVEDPDGLTDQDDVVIEVIDNVAPALTVAADPLTVEAQSAAGIPVADAAVAAFLVSASATDDCDASPSITHDVIIGNLPLGETTVTWTGRDLSGNEVTAGQTITVVDTTPPAIASITAPGEPVECAGQNGTSVTVSVSASDVVTADEGLVYAWSVDGEPVADATGASLGASLDVGEHTIVVTVADEAGNGTAVEDGTVSVTIRDTTPPVVTAPTDPLVLEALGANGVSSDDPRIVAFLSSAMASDICDPSPGVEQDLTLASIPLGDPTVVTWTATDAGGNSASATQTITVVDTTPPAIASVTAPLDPVECASHDGSSISVSAAASDIVTTAEALVFAWTIDDVAVEAAVTASLDVTLDHGEYEIGVTATDAAGNVSTASTVTVSVVDTTPPELTVPTDPLVLEALGPNGVAADDPRITAFLADATSSDVCDPSPGVAHDVMITSFPLGETLVTWTATDESGNNSVGSQAVKVQDTTAPEVIAVDAPSDPLECTGGAIPVTLTAQAQDAYLVTPTNALKYQWFDGQGNAITPVMPQPVYVASVGSLGEHVFRVVAIDEAGNVSPLPAVGEPGDVVIEVVDTTAPEITVSADIEYLWPGNHKYNVVSLTVSALDVCDTDVTITAVAVSSQPDNGNGNGDGNTTGDVRVTTADDEELLSSNGEPEVHFDPVNDVLEIRAERANNDVRVYTITVTGTDESGNSAVASVEVRVEKAPKNAKVATKPALTKPITGLVDVKDETIAFGTSNYPNPFNPYTIIEYGIPDASQVRLIVYNVLGQQVRVLEDGYLNAGKYAVRWDGRDEFGRSVASGAYLYRLQAGLQVAVGRMQFVK